MSTPKTNTNTKQAISLYKQMALFLENRPVPHALLATLLILRSILERCMKDIPEFAEDERGMQGLYKHVLEAIEAGNDTFKRWDKKNANETNGKIR